MQETKHRRQSYILPLCHLTVATILLLGGRCCWTGTTSTHGESSCSHTSTWLCDAAAVEGNESNEELTKHSRRAAATESNDDDSNHNDQCGMYMAESSIPNAGLGIFTAKSVPQFAPIMANDLALPIEDVQDNLMFRKLFLKAKGGQIDPKVFAIQRPWWILEDYFWTSRSTLTHSEADQVDTLLPGIGMLANGHVGLANAVLSGVQKYQELHRGVDPGAGASTMYHDVMFLAQKGAIPAGSEIFLNYGNNWFEHRTPELGKLPLEEDFTKADVMLEEFWRITGGDLETDLARSMYKLLLRAVQGQERLAHAFPLTLEEVPLVRARGGTAAYSIPGDGHVKSVDWLQTHGWCVDHLRPGQSTLRQAGRGAFATRKLTAGTVVAPLPVLPFPREFMELYENWHDSGTVYREGSQLMLNYCYGHHNSPLLFFPYAPVVNYINHNATLVNVKLQWSSRKIHRSDWFEQDADSVAAEPHAGLIMELIATRDIAEGDEVFLDYGSDWEEAWNEYVANTWKTTAQDNTYVSATQWNDRAEPVLTEEEQQFRPYPENIYTSCFTDSFRHDDDETNQGKEVPRATELLYEWKSADDLYIDGNRLYPCTVVRRYPEDGHVWYDVRIHIGRGVRNGQLDTTALVHHVPRRAIIFEDHRYTSDHALLTAFRHEIGIPDEMLPAAWRDL